MLHGRNPNFVKIIYTRKGPNKIVRLGNYFNFRKQTFNVTDLDTKKSFQIILVFNTLNIELWINQIATVTTENKSESRVDRHYLHKIADFSKTNKQLK